MPAASTARRTTLLYKDRWQVELFFKALKQNLKIKTFVGTSPNALKVQVWTALIAISLEAVLHEPPRLAVVCPLPGYDPRQ
jgi:IS4 transposase